jgi:Ran GTPase-activating protein (RanGAP) involved in mRNA processing and transport
LFLNDHHDTTIMTTTFTILSLHGKGLKLDTRADIEPWLKDIDPTAIEEIHFGGNTIGVDASIALAEFLKATTKLKVHLLAVPRPPSPSHNPAI